MSQSEMFVRVLVATSKDNRSGYFEREFQGHTGPDKIDELITDVLEKTDRRHTVIFDFPFCICARQIKDASERWNIKQLRNVQIDSTIVFGVRDHSHRS